MFVSDILTAFVTECRDGGLVDASGQQEPAMLLLQIAIPMKLRPGTPAPVYLVKAAAEKAESEEERVM